MIVENSLADYLHDHLGGSTFALELLEKLASEFAGTPSGEVARELFEQVQMDRRTLEQLIAKIGKPHTGVYDALGWIAERISRVKFKHDEPLGLGTFEAFETLSLGILGKRGLWEALQVHQAVDDRLLGLDYPTLIARAQEQFEKANQHRLQLTKSAFS